LVDAVRRRGGVATRYELDREGLSNRAIAEAIRTGRLTRSGRGLYRLPEIMPFGDHALAQAALLFPEGVIALTSALAFHELTTQIPRTVDVAVPRRASRQSADIPIRTVVMPKRLIVSGVVRARGADGVRFPVFSVERSVSDAFRYVDLVGEDVAYEALRRYIESAAFDRKSLERAARETDTEHIIFPVIKTLSAS
jgi:predicted transcriptional regulator of viral defense system